MKWEKGSWISHDLLRNCLIKEAFEREIEGRIEETERRWRRCKHLLKLKREELDRSLWRTGFGRGCWPVVRQTVASQIPWYWQCCSCECIAITPKHSVDIRSTNITVTSVLYKVNFCSIICISIEQYFSFPQNLHCLLYSLNNNLKSSLAPKLYQILSSISALL